MSEINAQTQLKTYQQALLKNPKDLDAQIMCGNLCVELQQFEEAAGYFRRVVRILKNNMPANNALCFALQAMGNLAHLNGQFLQAEACFAEALEYQPKNSVFWYNLGNAQRELTQIQQAAGSFKQAIKYNPTDADTHNNLGNVLRELGQLDKAIISYENALKCNPDLHHALAHLVHQRQHICDWVGENNNNLTIKINALRQLVKTVPSAQISPFAFLAMPNTTAQEQLQCATNYANIAFSPLIELCENLNFQHKKYAKTKLNIGFLSADFRLHPLAFLITDLIENHDAVTFETFAYSYGATDQSAERKHLESAFNHFNNIRLLNDFDAASKIYADKIDILVDLTGYTQSSRTGLVALKPAPISVNWLGYPGSMGELAGKSLFNYIIADNIIATDADNFSEEIIYLPFYQPNNAKRPVAKSSLKTAHRLPENAFVFCCFNQSFKITADIFAAWMQILQAVPNSVLWLLDCNQWAKANLQAACTLAGIDNTRIIFAPRVAIAAHLERHNHADLFLDTRTYNAHTTASDALYMNLPVLTCISDTFASRVAASLAYRINVEELVTDKIMDYIEKAIMLANHPTQLHNIKQKIQQYADDYAIFNPANFMQQLTLAYQKMWLNYINNV